MDPFEKFSDKLIFEALIPGLEEFMPIIPAKDFKHEWLERAKENFKKEKAEEESKFKKFSHTARCPGIINLVRTGWIVRTWQDIIIETNGDLQTFKWTTPVNQKSLCINDRLLGEEAVQWHPKEQFFNFRKDFPKDTLQNIIKICLPWDITIPKGFNLLELPIPYNENTTFTVLPGMFTFGIASCNIQLLWHKINDKVLIPAGTALAQYILVPEEQPETVVRKVEDTLRHDVYDLHMHSRFTIKYGSPTKE